MEWQQWGWSPAGAEPEAIDGRFVLDVFINKLVVVTKEENDVKLGELYSENIGELFSEYIDHFENLKPNEKCKYAQQFGMGDEQFKNEFIILYESMANKQPEILI